MADKQVRFVLTATDSASPTFDKVRRSLAGVASAGDAIGLSFGALGASVASALSVGGIASFVASTVRGIDALNDLKDATGSSIENISALEDVALRTGTSFETVGTALLKFNKALNEAKPGSQIAADLKAIGLEASALRSLDPAEALLRTALALDQFADDGAKGRLSIDLFGKSLRDIAPLLNDLAQRGTLIPTITTEQAEQAEKFTHAIDALKKNSVDAGRAIVIGLLPTLNDLGDEFQRGEKGASVYATMINALLVPIEALSVLGANVAFVFKGVGREIGAIAAQGAALARGDFAGFSAIADAVTADAKQARKELDAFEARILKLRSAAGAALADTGAGAGRGLLAPGLVKPSIAVPDAKRVGDAVKQYDELIARIQGAVSASNMEADAQAKLSDSQRLGLEVVKQLSSSENALSNDAKRRVAEILDGALRNIRANELRAESSAMLMRAAEAEAHASDAVVSAIQGTISTRTDENRQLSESVTLYGASADAIDRHRIKLLEDALAVEDAAVAVERAHSGSTLEVQAMQASADALRRQIGLRKELADANRQLGTDATKGAQNAIDDFLDSVRRAGDATYLAVSHSIMALEDAVSVVGGRLKFSFSGVVDQILTDFLRLRVIKPLLADIFGGSIGDSGLTLASMFGNFFGGALASGGPVNTGRAYLVGEHGPELLIPRAAGQVVPITEKSSGGWGGVTINQTNHFGSNVSRAEIVQAIALGNARLKADLARQTRHGSGAYA